MSLTITVVSEAGIWQSSDHRLSNDNGIIPEDTIKHIQMGCTDGKALISYVGIGSVDKTHISDWVRKLLRGSNGTIENNLSIIKETADKRLTPHCKSLCMPHTFSIGAFVNNEPRIYFITNRLNKSPKIVADTFSFRGIRLKNPRGSIINIEGIGSSALQRKVLKHINRIIKKNWNKPTLNKQVMDYLAFLNKTVARHPDYKNYISEDCLVSYLLRDGTAAHKFYKNEKSTRTETIPFIARGFDIKELLDAIGDDMIEDAIRGFEAMKRGEKETPKLDVSKQDQKLRRADFKPRDELE